MKTSLGLYVLFAGLFIVFARECKDRLRVCSSYPKYFCDESKSKYIEFMKRNCGKTCGFCDCRNWMYKCCRDRKTRADGPNQQGCALKLCYDVAITDCKKWKKQGLCSVSYVKTQCPWSCQYCKSPAAPINQCHHTGYGCCWDGSPALGPNGRGCPPCQDIYRQSCSQFKITPCSNTGAYYTRTFLMTFCPQTCGYCPVKKCSDKDDRCASFLSRGYCDNHMWRPYLANICAKTCGFCKDEEKASMIAKK